LPKEIVYCGGRCVAQRLGFGRTDCFTHARGNGELQGADSAQVDLRLGDPAREIQPACVAIRASKNVRDAFRERVDRGERRHRHR
jgi:hypothetical protein